MNRINIDLIKSTYHQFNQIDRISILFDQSFLKKKKKFR